MKNFLLSCIAIVNASHVGLASRGKIGKQSMSLQSIIQSNPSPAICFACCEHGPKSNFLNSWIAGKFMTWIVNDRYRNWLNQKSIYKSYHIQPQLTGSVIFWYIYIFAFFDLMGWNMLKHVDTTQLRWSRLLLSCCTGHLVFLLPGFLPERNLSETQPEQGTSNLVSGNVIPSPRFRIPLSSLWIFIQVWQTVRLFLTAKLFHPSLSSAKSGCSCLLRWKHLSN